MKVVRNNSQLPNLLYLTTTNESQVFITAESLLTAINEVRKVTEVLQYREQKWIAIQEIIAAIKYIPHNHSAERAPASETLQSTVSFSMNAYVTVTYLNETSNYTKTETCECGVYGLASPVANAMGVVGIPKDGNYQACDYNTEFTNTDKRWIALIERGTFNPLFAVRGQKANIVQKPNNHNMSEKPNERVTTLGRYLDQSYLTIIYLERHKDIVFVDPGFHSVFASYIFSPTHPSFLYESNIPVLGSKNSD
ncbi:hypothetical protein STEG23_030375 [Scotinomys teguina]